MLNLTGYGPSTGMHRLCFNGEAEKFELWYEKFLGYLRLKKLHEVVVKVEEVLTEDETQKNEEAYAALVQVIDDVSLSIVMRDAKNDGRAALRKLKEHYCGSGKQRILSMYSKLTSLHMAEGETTTDYVLKAEAAWTSLADAGEKLSEGLIIAMLLKGLPETFKAFEVYITQSEKEYSLADFRKALREFEDHLKPRSTSAGNADSVMKMADKNIICFSCKKRGHKVANCKNRKPRWCDHCKSKTHDTAYCKKKSDKAASVEEHTASEDVQVVFKISVLDESDVSQDIDGDMMYTMVDCGATAHIINDKKKFVNWDPNFDPSKHVIEVADGSRSTGVVKGKGKAKIKVTDAKGQTRDVYLENALYIPSYKRDIFSVQAATLKGANVSFSKQSAELKSGDTVFPIKKKGRLYYLYALVNNKQRSAEDWHRALGHCNIEDLLKLPNVTRNMSINGNKSFKCETCVQGKMPKSVSKVQDKKADKPLLLVHSDVAGPIGPECRDGYKYVVNFVNDYPGCSFVYFVRNKSDTVLAIKKFLADVAPYGDVKCMRTDNGTEYVNSKVEELFLQYKIRHEKSSPYSPHQNGTAERNWRTLFNTARCFLIDSGMNKSFWHYALLASNFTRNRFFNKRLGLTPVEAFSGKRPDLSKVQVFGSICYYCGMQ